MKTKLISFIIVVYKAFMSHNLIAAFSGYEFSAPFFYINYEKLYSKIIN